MQHGDGIQATTIVCVRKNKAVAMGGDGQVSLGNTVVKASACKLRRLHDNKVIAGFAGSAADAFALLERFEKKLSQYSGQLTRAAIELAKDWRTDRALRRLESMMIVADKERTLLLGGSGDVIEPDDGIIAIGSGGSYALAAARALAQNTELPAPEIAEKAMHIAAGICVYTNEHITVETL